jgi:hypothetical protein
MEISILPAISGGQLCRGVHGLHYLNECPQAYGSLTRSVSSLGKPRERCGFM